MARRLFLFLGRGELATVSYFPVHELEADPDCDWVEERLLPAVRKLARRRARAIRETPLTFWIGVRSTARLDRGEVFLFVTPWRLPRQVDDAVSSVLRTLPDAKVKEGVEPVLPGLVPCCQAFRGHVLRFFGDFLDTGELAVPGVIWRSDGSGPMVGLTLLDDLDDALRDNADDAEEVWVRAEIKDVTRDGEFFEWQRALANDVAMMERKTRGAKRRG